MWSQNPGFSLVCPAAIPFAMALAASSLSEASAVSILISINACLDGRTLFVKWMMKLGYMEECKTYESQHRLEHSLLPGSCCL